MVGNRFAITLVDNLTPFYNFIMFLTYFLKNLFKKKVVCFFSKQHGIYQFKRKDMIKNAADLIIKFVAFLVFANNTSLNSKRIKIIVIEFQLCEYAVLAA